MNLKLPTLFCLLSYMVIAQTPITSDGNNWEVSNLTADNALAFPYEITYGPDGFLWITQRGNYNSTPGERVVRVNPADGAKTTMINLSSQVSQTAGQDGLMGMAIHPDLYTDITTTTNNYVFVAYTYNSGGRKLRIARLLFNNTTKTLSPDTSLDSNGTIIQGIDASNDHNSGRLKIGPDLKLYYTIGDQGANQFGNACKEIKAQFLPSVVGDYSNYKGKTLRLNLDGSVPTDNPTINGFQSHIYTYGHRNPQGIIFGSNGILYSSEHGPKTDDEINIIESGNNYGWPLVSGYQDGTSYYEYCNWSTAPGCADGSPPNTNTDHSCLTGSDVTLETDPLNPTITEPIKTFGTLSEIDDPGYDFTPGWFTWPTTAPSSIDIYENGIIPDWNNSLIIPTLKKGTIYRAKLSADGLSIDGEYEEFHSSNDRYRDIAFDPDGITMYAITDNSGGTSGPSGTTQVTIENPGVIVKIKYIGPTLSTNDFAMNSDFKLIPNPATNNFRIQYSSNTINDINIEIFDIQGRKVKQVNNLKNNTLVNTTDLSNGSYFVKIYDHKFNSINTKKLIVFN